MLGQEPVRSSTQSEILRSRMIMRRAAIQAGLDLVVSQSTWPVIGPALLRAGVERPRIAVGGPSVWAGDSITVTNLNVMEDLHNQEITLTVSGDSHYQLRLTTSQDIIGEGKVGELFVVSDPYLELAVSEITAPVGSTFTLLKRSEPAMIRDLQSRFRVAERGRDTGILELTLVGSNPDELRISLNAISEVYLVQNINRQAAEAENRLSFLEEQAPQLRETLTDAENALNQYRASRESVDLDFETQSMLQRLVEVESRLNELELEENELSQRFTRSHPSYNTLLEQKAQLQNEREALDSRANNLPETQRQVLRLTRDVEVTQQIYMQMLNSMQELRIARAGTVGNVRILDEAFVSASPISPRRSLIAVMSAFIGFVISLIMVIAKHMLHRGLESVEQIQARGLQVYATIPLSEQQETLDKKGASKKRDLKTGLLQWPFQYGKLAEKHSAVERNNGESREQRSDCNRVLAFSSPTGLAIESLRSLRTSLHFAMLEAKNRVLMITSPSPGAGKSFVSVNLAGVCAQAGQRVLLIDGDLRKGRVHSLFRRGSSNGLSDVLVGNIKFEQAVRITEDERLDYISRGTAPPNPSELLMTERFTQLLSEANSDYDLVIVDTPPTLAVTDAAIIGKQVGTSLMVVRFRTNSVREIERSTDQLLQSGVPIKGVIFNALKRTATSYYGYGNYHYGYRVEKS